MEIGVLGPLELRSGAGEPVPVAGARLRTLLIVLALDANRVLSADRLIDAVWGAEPPSAAGNALQALISRLRRAGLTVEAAATGYRLVIDPERVDAHRFAGLALTRPAEALALWRGDLEFPEASRPEATGLAQLRLTAQRAVLAEQVRTGADVTAQLEALVAAHPLDEGFAALLMRALAAQGHPGRALQVYADVRERLAETLGADPSAELTELHLELLRAEPAPRGNLPAPMSSFVGRDADVRAVRALVAEHRLVTLTGPGGSGKTRLSIEAGAGVPGEVWQVELAPVTDPGEVASAVLSALRLRSQVLLAKPGGGTMAETIEPHTRLTEAVAGRRMLIVLDNCEHLIEAVARVAEAMLHAAPGLRLLATSREPLGIPGERIHPVEPLALPPEGAAPEAAAGFPAVRLLLDRAGPALGVTDEIVRICRALDGMPLALELAAARLRTLPPAVVADRLADRFRLLTGGSRTALPRHQTLRAMVDWSWELLTEDERALWRRFSVFQGGAGVPAVEAVCGADIDLLGALVDKSLLVLRGDRYLMLETLREYGRERLTEAGETERMRRAHAAYFTALADTAEPHLRRAEQLVWLRRLNAEQDNLHAAVRGAVEAGDAAAAYALTARLGWYWWLSGHRAEGAALARDVLGLTGPADREDRATTYAFAGINGLEGVAGMDEVMAWFREAEKLVAEGPVANPALRMVAPMGSIFHAEGRENAFAAIDQLVTDEDPWLRAVARMMGVHMRLNYGHDTDTATAELRTALAEFRSIGERWGIGFTLSSLGDLTAAQGEFAQAVQWQREAIALVREVGIREDLPQLQLKLADQLRLAGDHAEARRMLKQARQSAEELGLEEVLAAVEYGAATMARLDGDLDGARERIATAMDRLQRYTFAPQYHAMVHSTRALIEAAVGDLPRARELHAEALRRALSADDYPVIALVLVGVADLVLREGDPARAARLLGAADGIRGATDRSLSDADRVAAVARAALGDAGFEACYADGLTVTPATAVAASGLPVSDPAAEGPDRQRGEDDQQCGRPEQ